MLNISMVARAAKSSAISVVAIFAALLMTAAPASAIYTYTYVPVDPTFATRGTLIVTDAAVASGSLNYVQRTICQSGPCDTSGDPTGLVSLNYGGGADPFIGGITSPNNAGSLIKVGIAFNPDGTLTGIVTGLDGIFDNDFITSGVEFNWAGYWNNEAGAPNCPATLWRPELGGCYEPGYWYTSQALPNAVTEPSSLSLLFGGALALGLGLWLSRRKAQPAMPLL